MLPETVAELVRLIPVPYQPPAQQRERPCDGCHVDLMKAPHDTDCPSRPLPDDVFRLATTPAARRVEDALVACHRRGVRAWLKSGRTL